MSYQVADYVVGIAIVVLIVIEWRYRAKQDSRKEATGALVFAGAVFGVAYLAQSYFGLVGLLIVLTLLMAINLFLFWRRSHRDKIAVGTAMQRHHDYYVKLDREGKLQADDRYGLALAMLREEAGEVDPLPENEEE